MIYEPSVFDKNSENDGVDADRLKYLWIVQKHTIPIFNTPRICEKTTLIPFKMKTDNLPNKEFIADR